MSENARGKGRKRALGSISSRQIPSIVQPSGTTIDELTDLEEPVSGPPQMVLEETLLVEEVLPAPRRRQQS